MQTYFIKTFGCQMNNSDSERISGFLGSRGVMPAANIEDADLVVINTCGVRQSAEDRVYGLLNSIGKNNSGATVVLTGCVAHRDDVQRKLSGRVNIFVSIDRLSEVLSGILLSKKSNNALDEVQDNIFCDDYLHITPRYTSKFSADVPIMTGCNNFCAYCVVPYARGREKSRPVNEVLAEIGSLVEKGCKEIVLLGQNVNSYKSRMNTNLRRISANRAGFAGLIKMANSIPGNFWIRFMTSHPKDMSDELIKTIARSEKVCECVHLPIQAGDNKVLQRMNRKYSAEHYINLVHRIRQAFGKYRPRELPVAISTDIIVGFPGETREQFLRSAEVVKSLKFDMVYTARFSPRPQTAAWEMRDNVAKREKEKREKYLVEILKKTALENNKKYEGKIADVLVEKEKNGFCFGKTRTAKHVKFPAVPEKLIGKFVKVKIKKANAWNLEGEITSFFPIKEGE